MCGKLYVSGQCTVFIWSVPIGCQETHCPCFICDGLLEEDMARPALITAHQNPNIQSTCSFHPPFCCRDMDPARRRCSDPRELPHEMPVTDTQRPMAGTCPKHWSNKPEWLTASYGARCQTLQLCFRTHCQDATHCPSSPGSTLSSQVVTRPTTRLVVEASSRSPQQAMAGPDSRRQQPSTRWGVERCCQMRSFWSDATVQADLATMMSSIF